MRALATRTPARAAARLGARSASLRAVDTFAHRHLGPRDADVASMLKTVGAYATLEDLAADAVPAAIRLQAPVELPAALSESEALAKLRAIANKNVVVKNMIGTGYYETHTPNVILRVRGGGKWRARVRRGERGLVAGRGRARGKGKGTGVWIGAAAVSRNLHPHALPFLSPPIPLPAPRTSSRALRGTRRTRRTRRRFRRAASSRCSTSRR